MSKSKKVVSVPRDIAEHIDYVNANFSTITGKVRGIIDKQTSYTRMWLAVEANMKKVIEIIYGDVHMKRTWNYIPFSEAMNVLLKGKVVAAYHEGDDDKPVKVFGFEDGLVEYVPSDTGAYVLRTDKKSYEKQEAIGTPFTWHKLNWIAVGIMDEQGAEQ